ncbi:MAG: ATPase domain-containing protein [Candidatus Bathyarchaeota archaeon]
MEFLSRGGNPLDKILDTGMKRGEVTLVYGESGTGKTSLAIQCAFLCAKIGLKTIFIDSDRTFSSSRLVQIADKELKNISPLIFVVKPSTFHEQTLLVASLENYNLQNIALIIVDSITNLYKSELDSTEKIFVSNMKLNWQLAYLTEIAKLYNISILLTSQVRSIFREGLQNEEIEPIANRVLSFWSQKIIKLEKIPNSTIKKAKIEKDKSDKESEMSCSYFIEKRGIVNVNESNDK